MTICLEAPPAATGPTLPDWLRRAMGETGLAALRGDPRSRLLNDLMGEIARALSAPLVLLARKREDLIEIEARSSENLLWSEFQRIPERLDGTISGQGPAARALRGRSAVRTRVDDEGFIAWREAALREKITGAQALPIDSCGERVLVVFEEQESSCENEVESVASAIGDLMVQIDRLEQDRWLSAALSQAGNPAFLADGDGMIAWYNEAFRQLSGYGGTELIGCNPRMLSSGQHGVSHYHDLWNTILAGQVWRGETVDCRRDGESFTALQTISPVRLENHGTRFLAVYQDISNERAEQVVRELQDGRDPLTGLMHRAALMDHIDACLVQGLGVNVLRISARALDALDGLGEGAAASFSEELEQRLAGLVSATRLARLRPGDYLAWLPEDPKAASAISQSIREVLLEPYPYFGGLPEVDLRIGHARAPRDGRTVRRLLLQADRDLDARPALAAIARQRPYRSRTLARD